MGQWSWWPMALSYCCSSPFFSKHMGKSMENSVMIRWSLIYRYLVRYASLLCLQNRSCRIVRSMPSLHQSLLCRCGFTLASNSVQTMARHTVKSTYCELSSGFSIKAWDMFLCQPKAGSEMDVCSCLLKLCGWKWLKSPCHVCFKRSLHDSSKNRCCETTNGPCANTLANEQPTTIREAQRHYAAIDLDTRTRWLARFKAYL